MVGSTTFALQYAIEVLQEHLAYEFPAYRWQEFATYSDRIEWEGTSSGHQKMKVVHSFIFPFSCGAHRVEVVVELTKKITFRRVGTEVELERVCSYQLDKLTVNDQAGDSLVFIQAPGKFKLSSAQ